MTDRIAAQMYTVRDFTNSPSDLRETLRKISEIGYKAVQLSAVGAMSGSTPSVSASEAKSMLDEFDLKCIATHSDWNALANKTDDEIAFHKTLGCDYIAIGSMPGAYGSEGASGYERFVEESAPIIAKLKSEGIRFGYHNHSFEFLRIGPGARTLYDILLDANSDLMLEIDFYWVMNAGINPERLLEKANGRVAVTHVKDREVVGNDGIMAPVGEGNMDWEHILPLGIKCGVEWFTVEQDTCRRDPFDCLRSSYDYLKSLLG